MSKFFPALGVFFQMPQEGMGTAGID